MKVSSTKFRLAGNASLLGFLILAVAGISNSQSTPSRVVSGVVTTDKNEVVSNVTMVASFASGKRETLTGTDGSFRLRLPNEPVN
jgi:hypothetical protein